MPQIKADYLKDYFRQYSPTERERVKFFCCDMHNGYVSTAKEIFPHATICIDMFHVINRLNEAVDAVRRRLQNVYRESAPETYELLKHTAYLLKTKESNQVSIWKSHVQDKRNRLQRALDSAHDLKETYEALQRFHQINEMKEYTLQRAELTEWISGCLSSEVPELKSAANTVMHWRTYIQNSWKYNRSNGPCEGLNNKIKVLKRISFGLHHFKIFRKRVLLTCGPIHLTRRSYTIFQEKMASNGKEVQF